MADDDIETWIIDLIEMNMDEENRRLALRWLQTRTVAYSAMLELGLLHPDDLKEPDLGLKAKGK